MASAGQRLWDPSPSLNEAITEMPMLAASNVMLDVPNGVGTSRLACILGHQAMIQGHTVLFITAGQLLDDRPKSY